jgi:TRAP-type C4-dicarboxylate transport system permease small subunit
VREVLSRVLNRFERVLTAVTAVIMAMLSLVVCWQVFARYVLKSSPYWVEEFSVTAIMWIGLLGAAAAVWTGDHMSLELVAKRLPKKLGIWVEIIIDAAIGLFAVFLCSQGWVLAAATMSSRMATLPLPLGITYIVLPIAGVIMIVFAFARVLLKILTTIGPDGAGRKA